ncbi:MAG: hypothetical protein ACR2JV_02950 [Gaiellales bacterium]
MESDHAVPTLLDAIVPTWTHRTVHGLDVHASAERVAEAIRETSLDEARLASLLVAVRTKGESRGVHRPFVQTGDFEPGFVRLGEDGDEVCLGFIGRPWPGGAPERAVADAAAFQAAEALDAVKVAVSVRCAPASYGTLLLTETRIVVGPLAARTFGLYWRLVKPGSNLVRMSLLRAIARRAERGTLS